MSEIRDKDGLTEEEFLAAYRQEDYPRPSETTEQTARCNVLLLYRERLNNVEPQILGN